MLDDRENAFEKKYAIEGENEFKAKMIASKLFANWSSELMQMKEQEADQYTSHIIELNLKNNNFHAMLEYVKDNLKNYGVEKTNEELESNLLKNIEAAKKKLAEE